MSKKVFEVIAILDSKGWQYVGTKGDHRKFIKPGCLFHIIVAGSRNDDIPEGTYRAIIRKAGLKLKNN